jgi:hypothetical protein
MQREWCKIEVARRLRFRGGRREHSRNRKRGVMSTVEERQRVTLLTTVATEQQAALIVAALEDDDIEAHFAGETAASFRLGVPGGVQVFVRHDQLEEALAVLRGLELADPDETDDQEETNDISNWQLFVKLLAVIMLVAFAMSIFGDILEMIRTP